MASSSSKPPRKYEVFLSFRGEDTRNSFVSHLYAALHQRGIVTYMDEHNLQKGQSISPELLKSVEESKFAIIVFSKNYASSTWCLDELVKIMECRSNYGQTVIPIFYDVDPSDVRKQSNSFAESFAKHEANFKDNMEIVQTWKENLREAANIAGHNLSQRVVPEAGCINNIVVEIFSKLPRKSSAKGLVGMEDRVKKVSSLLARESKAGRFVGIWGMGGIGKTTTARAIFDELIGGFECSCFLQDVCKRDIVSLQKILLSKVLKLEHVIISDEYEGSNMIKNSLCLKRVLLVLDDVNEIKQLNSLAGDREWFGDGSVIFVTTRDKHLLNEVNELYEIETLSDSEALQLFCWHAFKTSHPIKNFVQLSHRVVSYAGGLPLALEVLGSYLQGRQEDVWESTLDRLRDDPEDKIFVALNISFDGLSGTQKDIFLDIACFFRGKREVKVNQKLYSFGFHPVEGITILIDKSLVHISKGEIQMHDLIQEMGWNIVRQKANKEPGRYSRLWDSKDVVDVLTNNTGTVEVEGMILKGNYNIEISPGAFRNMNNLRLLKVKNWGKFLGAPNYFPNTLRWLYWHNYQAKSLPGNFIPRNLVKLQLPRSSILQTPDIPGMPNLGILDLKECRELLKVHPSVEVHNKLVHLNLSGCWKLEEFSKIIQMKSLEILNLEHCNRLKNFPDIHSNMTRLRILNLEYCSNLRALPRSLCGLKCMESITLSRCSKLEYFFENGYGEADLGFRSEPASLKRKRAEHNGPSKMLTAFLSLPSLRTLNMSHCNVSELILPESIGCLNTIQELDLGGNKIVSLPESINRFSCLQVLHLSCCYMLRVLPELPSSVTELDLGGCTALERIPNPVDLLGKCKKLIRLSLARCEEIAWNVPQLLSAFRDWQSTSNMLSTRQEVLHVNLPLTEFPDWLYHSSTGPLAKVTLSPSSYDDKLLRGFVLVANCECYSITVLTDDDPVTGMPRVIAELSSFKPDNIVILYIPIDNSTRGREFKVQNECCLFEASTIGDDIGITWKIRLLYECEGDVHTSDLRIDNHFGDISLFKAPTMKVCVMPRSQIQCHIHR